MWGGCACPISTRSVLSRGKQCAVSRLHATSSLSAPCPLLWGAANTTCPNLLVTAKRSGKDPSARIRPLPTTKRRIPGAGQVRHRVNALTCASKQSLLRNPMCPGPSALCMHVRMHTRTHVHTCLHDGTEAEEGHRMISISGSSEIQAQGSWGYADFTRPWSVDTIYEPFDVKCYVTNKRCALRMLIPQKKMIRMVSILRSVCAFCSFHFQFALLFLKVHWGLLHLSIWFLSLSSYCNLLPLVI